MKRPQKYLSSEAHGYLQEAEACSLILKDLERISAKLQRRIDKEAAARQADFEAAMQYHSEAEIQDAYGWEFITEAQYYDANMVQVFIGIIVLLACAVLALFILKGLNRKVK